MGIEIAAGDLEHQRYFIMFYNCISYGWPGEQADQGNSNSQIQGSCICY